MVEVKKNTFFKFAANNLMMSNQKFRACTTDALDRGTSTRKITRKKWLYGNINNCRKALLIFFCFLWWLPSYCQINVERHDNGNVKFEGAYKLGRSKDNDNYKVPEQKFLHTLVGMPEAAVYDGHCAFYAFNGQKVMEGNYEKGDKQGKFVIWDTLGQIRAIQFYRNGMADSVWQAFDERQRLVSSFSYKTFEKSDLGKKHQVVSRKLSEAEKNNGIIGTKRNLLITDTVKPFEKYIYQFQEAIDGQPVNAQLHGPFQYLNSDGALLKGQYAYNLPVGNWEIIYARQRVFMVGFNLGITHIALDAEQLGSDDFVYTKPEVAPQPLMELSEFFRINRINHDSEYKGEVSVRFIITKTGIIDPTSIKVVQGLHPSVDAATMDLVRLLPAYKPALVKGKPVKAFMMVTIYYAPRYNSF